MTTTTENLGPAERIITALLTYTDHAVHNRSGAVIPDPRRPEIGVTWSPVTYVVENGEKVVYRLDQVGKKTHKVRLGTMNGTPQIKNGNRVVGEYRPAGLFPEVCAWMYKQIAEVWKLDNEFSARWASFAYGQEHRDLKVILAAFMLVQSRKGDPVVDAGKIAFYDDDYRDVGEAMLLLTKKDGKDFNPKLLLRVRDVLTLPQVAEINRQLGFGKSLRSPFLGRWTKAVEKWLWYREENFKMLEGLVKAGFRSTVMQLARAVGYKPISEKFFEILRWKQAQAKDGRRTLAIGTEVKAAESWEKLSERKICEKIVKEKPNFKRVVGLLPAKIGITRAIMAASIEAGSLSDKDLIIYTPTIEELGLLQVQDIRERWEKAVKNAEDTRAANIASRVKSKNTKEKLQEAADTALKKAVETELRGLRVYVFVDISGSMQIAIETAKSYIAKFLQGFPLEQLHVAVFNTAGRIVEIKHASAAGVQNAFRGITAGGGTAYGSGIRALQHLKPKAGEDTIFIFIGDEEQNTCFNDIVSNSGLNPLAFGLIKVGGQTGLGASVRETARRLNVPCFLIDEKVFADVYAIPRTLRNLIASTPVPNQVNFEGPKRQTLIEQILKCQLLQKPNWA